MSVEEDAGDLAVELEVELSGCKPVWQQTVEWDGSFIAESHQAHPLDDVRQFLASSVYQQLAAALLKPFIPTLPPAITSSDPLLSYLPLPPHPLPKVSLRLCQLQLPLGTSLFERLTKLATMPDRSDHVLVAISRARPLQQENPRVLLAVVDCTLAIRDDVFLQRLAMFDHTSHVQVQADGTIQVQVTALDVEVHRHRISVSSRDSNDPQSPNEAGELERLRAQLAVARHELVTSQRLLQGALAAVDSSRQVIETVLQQRLDLSLAMPAEVELITVEAAQTSEHLRKQLINAKDVDLTL
jgi:hypothetical protein